MINLMEHVCATIKSQNSHKSTEEEEFKHKILSCLEILEGDAYSCQPPVFIKEEEPPAQDEKMTSGNEDLTRLNSVDSKDSNPVFSWAILFLQCL